MKTILITLTLGMTLFMTGRGQGQADPYDEVLQQSDLVFSGTVVRQRCLEGDDSTGRTEAWFADLEVVWVSERSVSTPDTAIRIVYASVVPDSCQDKPCPGHPEIREGSRYFIFLRNDGTERLNPFAGGCLGVIEIFRDPANNTEIIATGPSCRKNDRIRDETP